LLFLAVAELLLSYCIAVVILFLCCVRNDVWRYQGWPGIFPNFGRLLSKGFVIASVAMVITIAADKMFGLKRDMHPPRLHGHHENSIHD